MKSSELHKLILKNGWQKVRQSGSHVIYQKQKRIYPVPEHGAKEVGTGLVCKIKKEMGLENL